MIERVISGGQTGADQAGWRVAKTAGIATGGWMPKGFLTEVGFRPEFAGLYGAREHSSPLYPPRTYANARDADATLWFGVGDSRGFRCTEKAAEGKPFFVVVSSDMTPAKVVTLLDSFGVRVLNVAGNRESSHPSIGAQVERYLGEVFRLMVP